MIALPLGQLVAFPAWGLLHAIIWIAETLASIPGSSLQSASFSLPLLTLYYAVLTIVIIEYGKQRSAIASSKI
jgi:hypothetical protein